jgi:sterol desaturase/sphingolipid hydroxylase (fatty acid hydroxylase superfamily)
VTIKDWRKFTPLYFYSAVALCLGLLAARAGFSTSHILILLVCGVLSWGLIEYCLHRFVFHYHARSPLGVKLLYQVHLSHHESPEAINKLFASLMLSVPIASAYWLIALAVTESWAAASYLFIGMATGYFYYEWLHFHCHHRKSRLKLFKYLRKYHLLHHYKTPELRFGVTSPLFDLVFGTFQPMPKRAHAITYK